MLWLFTVHVRIGRVDFCRGIVMLIAILIYILIFFFFFFFIIIICFFSLFIHILISFNIVTSITHVQGLVIKLSGGRFWVGKSDFER